MMGHNFSQANSLFVHIDSPFQYAGDIVTGTVYANVVTELKFKTLELQVLGLEETVWLAPGSAMGSGSKAFLQVSVPLHGAGSLAPGNYQFPFAYQLPNHLPGSFRWCLGETQGTVMYELRAVCTLDGGLMRYCLVHSAKLQLRQRTMAPARPLLRSREDVVSSVFCMARGSLVAHLSAPTDSYQAGGVIKCDIKVENSSRLDLRCVDVLLYQCVVLSAGKELATALVSGVDHGTQVQMARCRLGSLKAGQHLEAQCSLNVPRCASPSTRTALISCTYQLVLILQPAGLASTRTQVSHPIRINDPPPPEIGLPSEQLPEGWSPQVYPTASAGEEVAAGVPVFTSTSGRSAEHASSSTSATALLISHNEAAGQAVAGADGVLLPVSGSGGNSLLARGIAVGTPVMGMQAPMRAVLLGE